jgi:hypothetical protein
MPPRKYTSNAERQKAYRDRVRAARGAADRSHRSQRLVTVLFTCKGSAYAALSGVETYGRERDARTWPGGTPVIAHPPCAQWGRLRKLARIDEEEKALGPWAARMVRANGGVLEHPAGSTLWPAADLPAPGQRDSYGGFTLDVDQVIWGHKAQKRTWLYVCGCDPAQVPPMPPAGAVPTHRVTSSAKTFYHLPELSRHLREATPPALAQWLVTLARRCRPATCAAVGHELQPLRSIAAASQDRSGWLF